VSASSRQLSSVSRANDTDAAITTSFCLVSTRNAPRVVRATSSLSPLPSLYKYTPHPHFQRRQSTTTPPSCSHPLHACSRGATTTCPLDVAGGAFLRPSPPSPVSNLSSPMLFLLVESMVVAPRLLATGVAQPCLVALSGRAPCCDHLHRIALWPRSSACPYFFLVLVRCSAPPMARH
jgi:hypothetical protein